MNKLQDRFNPQVNQIAISLIRQFDERVSTIPNVLRLTLGEPDFDTPEAVKDAGIQAIEQNFSHYTGMAGLPEVREAACAFMKKKYHLDYDWQTEALVTVGGTEAISATLLSILEPGDKVLLPTPVYPGYEPVITLANAQSVPMDTSATNFVLTPELLETTLQAHGKDVKAVILNYPSNPIGVTYSREEIKGLAAVLAKYSVFVLCDEIYSELVYDEPHTSLAEFLPEQTIVINGLSKSHAMTGWRIGFIFGPQALVQEIVKVHQYLVTAASTISQKAAYVALTTSMNSGEEMKKEYLVRRDFVYQTMRGLGFEIAKPSGAFYLFAKIPAGYEQKSMDFCVDLAEKVQLALIPGVAFGQAGEGFVRISYAASLETLEEAMRRLTKYMQETKE
ncbi:pyridoxal phosphate-dependent aminotransferase [Enterococcus sp. LJL98]